MHFEFYYAFVYIFWNVTLEVRTAGSHAKLAAFLRGAASPEEISNVSLYVLASIRGNVANCSCGNGPTNTEHFWKLFPHLAALEKL